MMDLEGLITAPILVTESRCYCDGKSVINTIGDLEISAIKVVS